MGTNSKIEWTDSTWSPIRARDKSTGKVGWYCQRVSPGCAHCYSATMNRRLGNGADYTLPALSQVEIFLDEKMLLSPLHWREKKMVFVCSMTDLFADFVKEKWIDIMFAVMALCPQHTFQILTKRPERMLAYISQAQPQVWDAMMRVPHKSVNRVGGKHLQWPLLNVWVGTSCENQKYADERIPILCQVPAAVRFISAEPLIGPIDFEWPKTIYPDGPPRCCYSPQDDCGCHGQPIDPPLLYGLSLIITGGESGKGARPCDVEWIRSIIRQCKNWRVPVFVKQLGSNPIQRLGFGVKGCYSLSDSKGGDPQEWPDDVRIREFPEVKI